MNNIIAQINEDGSVLSVTVNTDIKGKPLNQFHFGNKIDSIISMNDFLNFVSIATLNPMIPNITEVYYLAKYENEPDWNKAIYDLNNHLPNISPEDKFKQVYLFKDGKWTVNNI